MDELTGTCFACFDRFPVLATVTMLYFAAAIYGEERERNGRAGPDDAFLLADVPEYRAIADRIFRQALMTPAADADRFMVARGTCSGRTTCAGSVIRPGGICTPYTGTLPAK